MGEITGVCPWFDFRAAVNIFAFDWEPYEQRSLHCDIAPDRVRIASSYREKHGLDNVIFMERRLVDVDGMRIAFHDALFVSPVPVQGPDILSFTGVYEMAVRASALETFPNLTLELDLTDPLAIDFLMNRGIKVP